VAVYANKVVIGLPSGHLLFYSCFGAWECPEVNTNWEWGADGFCIDYSELLGDTVNVVHLRQIYMFGLSISADTHA
jgi:hypothetical protein